MRNAPMFSNAHRERDCMLETLPMTQVPKCDNLVYTETISTEVGKEKLAWLAGILDGEGCIYFGRRVGNNGHPYYRISITVSNSDARMIRQVSEIYCSIGVKFAYQLRSFDHTQSKRKQLNIIVDSQNGAGRLLRSVVPYLVAKKDQAEIVLEFLAWRSQFEKGQPIDQDKVLEFRNRVFNAKHNLPDPSETTRRASLPLGMKI